MPKYSLSKNNTNSESNSKFVLFTLWRRRRDLNSCHHYWCYSLSRGAPWATWVFLRTVKLFYVIIRRCPPLSYTRRQKTNAWLNVCTILPQYFAFVKVFSYVFYIFYTDGKFYFLLNGYPPARLYAIPYFRSQYLTSSTSEAEKSWSANSSG